MIYARKRPVLWAPTRLARSAKLCRNQKRGFAPLPIEREHLLNL
jgi:hypothetical protein